MTSSMCDIRETIQLNLILSREITVIQTEKRDKQKTNVLNFWNKAGSKQGLTQPWANALSS